VDAAWQLFDEGDVLLVAGSSLTVFSGRRFIYRAAEHGKPVAIINQGPTRGDDLATIKVDAQIGLVLPHLAAQLAWPSRNSQNEFIHQIAQRREAE
jgi:NAD-dependent SIR2 family protein deacetylase